PSWRCEPAAELDRDAFGHLRLWPCPGSTRGRLHGSASALRRHPGGRAMNVIHDVCCGLDVHNKTVVACLIRTVAQGAPIPGLRSVSTRTGDLHRLAAWLLQAGCRQVALESTGIYWRPVFNILEPHGMDLLLLNAQHIKNVPGRKTDVKDAEWIAELL